MPAEAPIIFRDMGAVVPLPPKWFPPALVRTRNLLIVFHA